MSDYIQIIRRKLEELNLEQQWGDEIFFSWIDSSYLQKTAIPAIKNEKTRNLLKEFNELMNSLWLKRKNNPSFDKNWEKSFEPMWEVINKERLNLLKELEN